ncbi:hypothetical protein EUGRSUZ_G01805 [Eucalyptus grandis]|uniref:Uncharacterized protein n=2 Tax=Eucalyptus grandis TaxID=71139 RepID=A0ACC3K4X8_EUCGR|nr:hypothetical protein EUGRSUZ_G01805 [Eucalyptus grandis]
MLQRSRRNNDAAGISRKNAGAAGVRRFRWRRRTSARGRHRCMNQPTNTGKRQPPGSWARRRKWRTGHQGRRRRMEGAVSA